MHVASLVLFAVTLLAHKSFGILHFYGSALAPGRLVESLALTHAWHFPGPSWSISAEWLAYLSFPWVAWLTARLSSARTALALIMMLFMTLAYIVFVSSLGSMELGLPRVAVEFTSGVLLHRIYELRKPRPNLAADRCAAGLLLVFIVGSNVIDYVLHRETAFKFFPILACGIVYVIAASQGRFTTWLKGSTLQYLGRISYSLYLVHSVS